MTNGILLRSPPTERIILMNLHPEFQKHNHHLPHKKHNNKKTDAAKVLLDHPGQPFKNGCLRGPEMWRNSNRLPGLITDPS